MKTLNDYEKELKRIAIRSHDLQIEPDCVDIDRAIELIEEAAKNSFERGYCAGLVTKPNATVEQMSDEIKNKWNGIKEWFHKEFTNQ